MAFPLFRNSVVSNDIDFITADDASTYQSLSYLGRSTREMPGTIAGNIVQSNV